VVALTLYARRVLADPFSRRMAAFLLGGILVQYLLGVLTLVFAVPIVLGVAHQVTALLLFGVWTAWLHQARRLAGNHGLAARV
jgi:heme a synthase